MELKGKEGNGVPKLQYIGMTEVCVYGSRLNKTAHRGWLRCSLPWMNPLMSFVNTEWSQAVMQQLENCCTKGNGLTLQLLKT